MNKIIDFFTRAYSDDKVELEKARFLFISFIVTFCASSANACVSAYIDYQTGFLVCLFINTCHLIFVVLLKFRVSLVVIGNLFCTMTLLAFVPVVLTSGGVSSPVVAWFITTKVSAFWYANKLSGFIWSGISLLTVACIYVLQLSGVDFGYEYADESKEIFAGFMHLGVLGYYVLIVVVYNKWNEDAREIINKKTAVLAQQNDKLVEQTENLQAQKEEINTQREELSATLEAIEEERKKSDKLLLNILPLSIAQELKERGEAKPRVYYESSVLFTDFKGFTESSALMEPDDLISSLNECFVAFDRIMERHNLEKIKTIGDAYMAVAGVPNHDSRHAVNALYAALDIVSFMDEWKKKREGTTAGMWEIRIGIHSGPVISGVVGSHKFAYDIWGDTVNTAARMESLGEPGRVNISAFTQELIAHTFEEDGYTPAVRFIDRGEVSVKGKGNIQMFFVERTK